MDIIELFFKPLYLDRCWEVQQDMEQIEDVLYKVG